MAASWSMGVRVDIRATCVGCGRALPVDRCLAAGRGALVRAGAAMCGRASVSPPCRCGGALALVRFEVVIG